jgi:hypothetical protein
MGVGPLQLLIAQVRTRFVQAVPAVPRGEFLPRIARPVLKGLRDAVQGAARSQSPVSPARRARLWQAPAMFQLSPFRRLIRRAASKAGTNATPHDTRKGIPGRHGAKHPRSVRHARIDQVTHAAGRLSRCVIIAGCG